MHSAHLLHPGMVSRPTEKKLLVAYVRMERNVASPESPAFVGEVLSMCGDQARAGVQGLGARLLEAMAEEFPSFEDGGPMRGHRRREVRVAEERSTHEAILSNSFAWLVLVCVCVCA